VEADCGSQVTPKCVVPMEEEEPVALTYSMYALALRCSDQEVILFCLTLLSQPFHNLAYLLGLQLQLIDKCIPFLDTAGMFLFAVIPDCFCVSHV